MLIRWFLLATFASTFFLGTTPSSSAQNGQLIEGLFRTLAESQLERERRKRVEAEEMARREAQQRAEDAKRDPYEVSLPSGFGGPRPTTPPRPSPRPPVGNRPGDRPFLPSESGSINVRSEKAAAYAKNLVGFNQAYAPLVAELRSAAQRNPDLRAVLPPVYELSASGKTLLRQCDGLSTLSPIVASHREWDSRWRNVSFQLRSLGGLNDRCNEAIRRCDDYCDAMAKQLNLQPQFDRIALRDQMTIAAAYMQTLMDDLELSSLSRDQCHRLEHDCRLLRQQLLADADRIEQYDYKECVDKFNRFATKWREFSDRVYALGNAHMNRRLDRISECGEATYALLWVPPPTSLGDVGPIAVRLKQKLNLVTDKMTLRALTTLPPGEQIRVLESVRRLSERCDKFADLAGRANPRQQELQPVFRELDQTWCETQPLFLKIPSVNLGHVAEINRSCEQLREMLDLKADYSAPIRLHELVQAAAELEGVAEYLQDNLQRYEGSLQPSGFRRAIMDNSRSFYRHSRKVHELLSRSDRLRDPGHLRELQEETGHLLEDWNGLANQLSDLQNHGISGVRAVQLQRAGQEVVPAMAKLAAALLDQG